MHLAFWIAPLALTWAGRATAISLGIVAAIIAVVLFLAGRSKWGQNKPLTKCIALAVLAHVWLLMYAYGTRVKQPGFGTGGGNQYVAQTIEFMDIPLSEFPVEELAVPPTLPTPPKETEIDSSLADGDKPIEVPALLRQSEEIEVPADTVSPNMVAQDTESGIQATPNTLPSDVVVEQDSKEPMDTSASTAQMEVAANSQKAPEVVSTSPATQLTRKRRSHDQAPVPETYQLRMTDSRAKIASMFGGDGNTEAAVESALKWLAVQQEVDGSWDAAKHGAGRETKTLEHDRQGTGAKADTGCTALSLLSFLGAGYTHDQGKYVDTVGNGLAYLINAQMPSGDLAGPKQIGNASDVFYARMYCHGMALLALSEAYAMSGDRRLIDSIQRGAAYTLRAQNPQTGGWRYQLQLAGDPGDLSQFGWQAMALTSARHAGVAITPDIDAKLRRFLDLVGKGRYGGLAIYRPVPGQRPSVAMTAEALASRRLLGYPLTQAGEQEATEYILQSLPGRSEENVYFWYYATMALFQRQDQAWHVWNEALKSHLVSTQNVNGNVAGSWDPRCIWAGYGGRVYSTAMSCLCLEVYYRYLPMLQSSPAQSSPAWQLAQPHDIDRR
jgi:hypothetical protein